MKIKAHIEIQISELTSFSKNADEYIPKNKDVHRAETEVTNFENNVKAKINDEKRNITNTLRTKKLPAAFIENEYKLGYIDK